jgi:hypothetical protein
VGFADFSGFQNRIDAFFLRRVNERASIDDNNIGLRRFVRNFDAILQQRAEHDLSIDQILGAAQRDQADPQWIFLNFFLH